MRRVNTKLFKNGGSWAVRIPSDWVTESTDVQVVEKRPGVIEVHLLSRRQLFRQLVEETRVDPLTEVDLPIAERQVEPDRFDIAKLTQATE